MTDLLDIPTPTAPTGDRRTVVIVHSDAQDDLVYWCGYTNGHDGQGWTAERKEAMEFPTLSAANLERKEARKWHKDMVITLQADWSGAA